MKNSVKKLIASVVITSMLVGGFVFTQTTLTKQNIQQVGITGEPINGPLDPPDSYEPTEV